MKGGGALETADAEKYAEHMDRQLRELGDSVRAAQERRYLKSDLAFYGVSLPSLRRTTLAFKREHPEIDRNSLLPLVQALWQRPVHEDRTAACELLVACSPLLQAADMALVEGLIRESRTWALVDGLAANVAGRLVSRFLELGRTLDRWAIDADFWVRRSALLALLLPLRRGSGDFERFARYADGMLDETEFFIRKAIGWILRETGKKQPELVYGWLAPRVNRVSGVTIREAVKYLPNVQRDALMVTYRARRTSTETPALISSPGPAIPLR